MNVHSPFLKNNGLVRSKSNSVFIILLILMAFLPFLEAVAQGNLVIIPRRVVFDGSAKSQDITLANGGADTAKYLISLVEMRMKDDGSFEQITTPDPDQKFADKYLRFYPRTVTLAPKESQLIKMQIVRTENLEPGEYRSHIYFRAVPKTKPLGANETPQDSSSFSATLSAVFGITIPVIIRVGDTHAEVTLTNVAVERVSDTLTTFKMTINRTGNASTYGDVEVNYVAPDGKMTPVADVKGLAVYTPNAIRRFDTKLNSIKGIDYRKGKLKVTYTTKTGSKPVILAEAELALK
jgi:P pilus assembly chaperone PapD